MTNVIRLAHHRSVVRRDIPLEMGAGDSDLRPIAIALWTASFARVALAILHHETFAVEASLALLCVLFLPLLFARARYSRDTARP
jgi:hypothetical protein